MDLDRTSLGDRTQDLRTRNQQTPARPDQPTESPQPVQPAHGGALAPAQLDREQDAKPDPNTETRRQRLYEAVTRFLAIPGSTELDIQVDTQDHQVTFLIRDKRSGEVIREVPEDDASPLFEQLREFHGALIDRQF